MGSGERDGRGGVSRDLAEVLAAVPLVWRAARVFEHAPSRLRSGPAAAHTLERRRVLLPRQHVRREYVDTTDAASPVLVVRGFLLGTLQEVCDESAGYTHRH